VKYSDVDHSRLNGDVVRLAETWMNLRIRPDREH